MKYNMKQHIFRIAASVMGVIIYLSGVSEISRAAPGDLFVTTNGVGSTCTQASPCNLATALSQAGDGDTIYVAQGTYTSSGDAVITISTDVILLGGWDGLTTTPPTRDPGIYLATIDGQNTRRGYISAGISALPWMGSISSGGTPAQLRLILVMAAASTASRLTR